MLSTASKVFEKIILTKLKEEVRIEQLLRDNQFGFHCGRSTTIQLARVTYDIANNLNQNRSTAAILLDAEKAFDTVWNKRLMYVLSEFDIPQYLIKIIASFLSECSIVTKVIDAYSIVKNIDARVP